ncbi:MAG TPA: FCD domain-containing protein [Trebonia sp.]|jgi:DNA-binding GntR family transcriptional regulator|nr:FCD domain-containing protein [Trebonia sp.]
MPTAPDPELTRAELVEAYEIWQLLGPLATARAVSLASREQLLEATRLVSMMRTEDCAVLWAQYNLRFHRLLEDAGSGPRVTTILGELHDLTERHVYQAIATQAGLAHVANDEHEEILRAVLAGDAEAAADATFRHISARLDGLLTLRAVTAAQCPPAGNVPLTTEGTAERALAHPPVPSRA